MNVSIQVNAKLSALHLKPDMKTSTLDNSNWFKLDGYVNDSIFFF